MKAQPRAPLAVAAVAFACGIWLSTHWQVSPALWGWAAASLAVCTIVAVAVSSLRPAQAAALLALVCAGAFARLATPSSRLVVPPPEFLNVKDVEIVGNVTGHRSPSWDFRQPTRILAQPHAQQHPAAYSPERSLESRRRFHFLRHDHGRRFTASAQCPRRISADGRLSPAGGFRDECG